MSKIKNLKVVAALEALLMSGATLAGFSSCGKDDSKTNPAYNDQISVISDVDSIETTLAPDVTTDRETTYTTSLNEDMTEYETTLDDVETTNDTTYITTVGSSTKKGESSKTSKSTVVDTTRKGDTTTKVHDTTRAVDTTRRNDTTTKKVTVKVTTTTTKATTKKTTAKSTTTTTTTTTTAKPTTTTTTTTEEPIVTSEERQDYATLEDIAYSRYALGYFGVNLRDDLMAYQGSNFTDISMPYGVTGGGPECTFILAALNYDVPGVVEQLYDSFSYYDEQELLNCKVFIYKFNYVQQKFGNDVDYSKYTLNPIIGAELNRMDQAYRDGLFDEYIQSIIDGNIAPECLTNPGFRGILMSYDDSLDYFFASDFDESCIDGFMNDVVENVYGHSYTK